MSLIWSTFVEVLQGSLFWFTQFYGGQLGAAIVSFSLLSRLALLPFTYRLGVKARAQARMIKSIQPRREQIREKWKDEPSKAAAKSLEIFKEAGISPVDGSMLRGSLVQAPIFIGLYSAVRGILSVSGLGRSFLWISNLSRPDLFLAGIVTGIVGAATLAGAASGQPGWARIVPSALMLLVLLNVSAGFALYIGSSAAVGVLQGLLIRRAEART